MLIRRPDNKHRVLKELEFQTLLLCDGKTDFEDFVITDEMRGLAERIVDITGRRSRLSGGGGATSPDFRSHPA